VIAVVRPANVSVFDAERPNAGDAKYWMKLAKPTNAPE